MALSRLASQFAAEIRQHDWSDAHSRTDRAGHQRSMDRLNAQPQLPAPGPDNVRTNVMWVAAQVLGYNDPNFDVYEFAQECGVDTRTSGMRERSGHITAGLRIDPDGEYAEPGTYAYPGDDDDPQVGKMAQARAKLEAFVEFASARGWKATAIAQDEGESWVAVRDPFEQWSMRLVFHNANYIAKQSYCDGGGRHFQLRNVSAARKFIEQPPRR